MHKMDCLGKIYTITTTTKIHKTGWLEGLMDSGGTERIYAFSLEGKE